MKKRAWSWFATTTSVALLSLGCGGSDDGQGEAKPACPPGATQTTTATSRAALSSVTPARIFLTTSLLSRLVERAQAGDAAWSELRTQCDAHAGATVEPPSGAAYPKYPNIGQGYQGEDYLPAMMTLGLCYRVASAFDAQLAERHATAGRRLLEVMSTPANAGGFSPAINHGYGIRNYGVGMAIGYDWLEPTLTAALKTRVQSALAAWFDWYDASGFLHDQPVGNYFVGYFEAKTLAALALEGDDARATTYWNDVTSRLWGKLVKPTYSAYLDGGGWPEGWGYGPRAVRGIAEVLWAVKTAKNLDWHAELPQVRDQARYVSYFAWPSLARMDDHGTVRAGIPMQPSALLVTALATILAELGDDSAAAARGFAADVLQTFDDRKPWEKVLYWDPAREGTSYKTRALSYLAEGPSNVAMRSSWETDAAWGAFNGGPYINAPASSEQTFNSGALTVVNGGEPVLVNATGWLTYTAFTEGENFVYQDSFGGGGRRLYNTFYVDDPSNPVNPGQSQTDPSTSKARVDAYEETGAHVFARATGLEDQYRGSGVVEFTRAVVFLRPASFVVFDRTQVALPSADQWLAFHMPRAPETVALADGSQRRFDLASGGAQVGSLRTLLPQAPNVKTVPLPGGTTRIEVHASAPGESQRWLSVVSASSEVPEQTRLTAADGNVIDGDAVGVFLATPKNQVALFASGNSAPTRLEYAVPQTADAHHVLVGMAAGAYDVRVSQSGGQLIVAVEQGSRFQVSEATTLAFEVDASGNVSASAEPPSDPSLSPEAPSAEEPSGGATEPCSETVQRPCGTAVPAPTSGAGEDSKALGSSEPCP